MHQTDPTMSRCTVLLYILVIGTGFSAAAETLLFADGGSIIQSDITMTTLNYLVNDVQDISDLDFDLISNSLYWVNQISRKIQKTVNNGTSHPDKVQIVDFLDLSGGYPDSLAVDWFNRKLYWTDTVTNKIERISLDGSRREVIVSDRLNKPHRIIVDPSGDRLYWIDQGTYIQGNGSNSWINAKIEKSNLNGTDRKTLVTSNLGEPTALARDHSSNYLYWTDRQKHTLQKCNTQGWNRQTVISDTVKSSSNSNQSVVSDTGGVAISQYFIFWTESTEKTMYYTSKLGRVAIPLRNRNFVQPGAIHVYRQPVNKCLLQGGCDAEVYECTDEQTGPYLCSCPIGTKFTNGSCVDINECLLGLDNCTQKCTNTKGSYRCGCNAGFTLTNNTVCADVNECERGNHNCTGTCVNTPGSYYCSCSPGLQLDSDGRSCVKVTCPAPLSITGVNLTCDPKPYYVGHTCKLFCNNGKVLSGEPNMTCTTSGQWTQPATQPYCYTIPVEPPMQIDWKLVKVDLQPHSVYENARVGSHVGILSLTVPAQYAHIAYGRTTFSLQTPYNPFVLRKIANVTYLTVISALDYETTKSYKLNISALVSDIYNQPHLVSTTITVKVIDTNEPPSKPTLSKTSRPENLRNGAVVGLFKATDPDYDKNFPGERQRLEYFLTDARDSSGRETDIFEAADNYGLLLRGSFDYETSPYYTLSLMVKDEGNASLSATNTVTLNITDVNEAPTDIKLSNSVIKEIPEDNPLMGMPMRAQPTVGLLTTVDEDNPDFHTYEIIKDQFIDFHLNCFEIKNRTSPSSGQISVMLMALDTRCFDYERAQYTEVTIKSTDKGGLSYQKVFRIQVTDVNERPTGITFTGTDILEHSPKETTVGMLFVTDPDSGDYHNVTLVYSTNNWLTLRDNYKVVVAGDIDFEKSTYIKLRVKAEDRGGLYIYQNFTVMVQNKVEGPILNITAEPLYACPDRGYLVCVNETISIGKVVARVKSATGNTTIYIREHTGSFRINNQGDILVASRLDFESGIRTVAIKLTASGPLGAITETYIYAKILDVNEAPTDVLLSNTILGIDATVDTDVGELTCVDDSAMSQLTYRIVRGPNAHLFKIQGGYLTVAKSLPNSTLEYPVSIQCSDGVNSSPIKQYIIEHRTPSGKDIVMTLSNSKVLENADNGTVIGIISVSSSRTVDSFTVSLENSAWLPYEVKVINNTAASLVVGKPLDYEKEPYLDIVVKAYSHITKATAFKTFEIEIVNVPEKVVLGTNRFEECDVGTNLAMLTVADPAFNATYVFTIETPLPLKLTNLTATTAILTNYKALNFEDRSMGMGKKYKLQVSVRDKYNREVTIHRNFTVKIVNVNEAPTAVALTKSVVLENTPVGTVVSQLVVTDPDSVKKKQTFLCDFIRNDHGWFRLNPNMSLTVSNYGTIDYEDPSFPRNESRHVEKLVLDCWDQGGLGIESQVLEIEIKDVNEPPVDINTNPRQIKLWENMAAGTLIANVIVDDPDFKDTHTLQLLPRGTDVWTPKNLFDIENGNIVATAPLNFEERNEYKIKIIATDKAQNKLTRKFRINVVDSNDPPTDVFIQRNLTVLEGQAKGAFLSFVYTRDEDYDQGHSYEIVSQSPTGAVALIDNNKLVVANPLVVNYETSKTLNVTLKSTDKGAPPLSITKTLIIPVENVSEPPTGLLLTPGTVAENSPNGTVVGNITFIDPDTKVPTSYHYFVFLRDDAEGRFKVASYDWDLGVHQIVVANGGSRINYEEHQSFNITIFTLDYGSVHEQTLAIEVIDVPESPKGLIFEIAKPGNLPPVDIDVLANIDTWGPGRESTVIRLPEDTGLTASIKKTIAYVYVLDEDIIHITASDVLNKYTFEITDQPATRGKRDVRPRYQAPGVTDFGVEAVNGSKWLAVTLSLTLDYEADSTYKLYFTCKNKAHPTLSITQRLQIDVINVEEPPYAVNLVPNPIPENIKPDTKMGSLQILDQDPSSVYLVSLTSPYYSVYLSGMDVYASFPLDYESATMNNFRVLVSEISRTKVLNKTFTVEFNLTDVNEPPCCLSVNGLKYLTLPSNVTNGYKIGDLSVKDRDAADQGYNFRFMIVSVRNNIGRDRVRHFKIRNGVELVFISPITTSLSKDAKFVLTIGTTDSKGLAYQGSLNIRLNAGKCGNRICHQEAECVGDRCKCRKGYTGSGYDCSPINLDPCQPNPCTNGGKCFKHKDGNYLCQCAKQFEGLNCEVDKSACMNIKCPYGGTCIPGTQRYTCECQEPYSKDCSGCLDPNDIACKSTPTPDKSAQTSTNLTDKYLPAIIAVSLLVFLAIVIIVLVVFFRRRQRFKTVNRRIRFNSERDSVSVQSESDVKANGDNQFANPLYETVAFKNNNTAVLGAEGDLPDYTKKVPLDMYDDQNNKYSDLTRTMSQQEEVSYNSESQS